MARWAEDEEDDADETDPEAPDPSDQDPDDGDDDDGGGAAADTVPCSNCGRAVYDDADVCPHCGEAIVGAGGGSLPTWAWATIVVMLLAAVVSAVLVWR